MKYVLIIEDLPDTQVWLRALAEGVFPNAEITLAASLKQARQELLAHPWDVLLVDLGLPDGSGIELIREAREQLPNASVVVTTVYDDDDNLFQALAAGAMGYLLKSLPAAHLAEQLELMKAGHPPMSSSIARRLIGFFQQRECVGVPDVALTQRETEILSAIARGMRNREVAAALGLSPHTVGTYIRELYAKLNICNRAQAALVAQRHGLL